MIITPYHIQQNSSDQGKLFIVTKSLLCDTNTASFPRVDPVQLANDFGNFSAQKIKTINASLANLSTPSVPSLPATIGFNRPVSNLSYISKLSERAVVEQFMEHLTANNLHSPLQSAYKQQHSTETALLKVKNDILMSMDEQHVTISTCY